MMDEKGYMLMALEEARGGIGAVNPNPLVGAVIVKDGRVIGKGHHEYWGGPHAEPNALASCSEDPSGAVMYVTLEPCCHFGKRPPCTEAVIKAGISRVVAAMEDPNPLVAGKGLARLREAGIATECGLCREEAMYLNRVFVKYITTRRPWVVMKGAMTMDGRIAAHTGDSKWVTSEESRQYVQRLRSEYSGILVGIGTVLADDPMLNCRIEGLRSPVRIIADSHASLPTDSRIAGSASSIRTIVAHCADAPQQRLEALRRAGIETVECRAAAAGGVDMDSLFEAVGAAGVDSVLVEGGSKVNWSVIGSGAADELYLFYAPKIIGGELAKPYVAGGGFGKMSEALSLEIQSVTRVGEDLLVHAFPRRK